MEVKELGHIVLYVKDLERSRLFYRDILGWKEIAAHRSVMAAFSTGRTHHELLLIQAGAQAEPLSRGSRIGLYHFGLKIGTSDEELRAAVKKLEDAQVPIMGMTDHGVTHSVYLLDPDGNEIEIYIDVQPEKWRTDSKAFLAPAKPLRL
jgi:catechol 2,3-dioxygenase